MKTSELRKIIKEEIDSTLNENNVLKVIKHLSNKMKEYDTPMGENDFNDGMRRGLALAITKLNEIK